jgi:hypothetical protein
MGGTFSTDGGDGRYVHGFSWKLKEKIHIRRHRRRWEDSIKTNLIEIGLEGVDWMHLAKDMDQ